MHLGHLALGVKHQQFYGYAIIREYARDVYSRNRIIALKKLTIFEWHNYKYLEWITVRRDDDMLYTFKKGDYNRVRLQDIEDMMLFLVQGKLTNLNIEGRLALDVSLRFFTRSIVIKRHMEDLQLGVKSYQKKLNLTKPDTYISDLKRKAPYTAYSTPRGFIYQNQDKNNRLMCIDEFHKFSDSTLNDVWSALDDILKKIRMKKVSLMLEILSRRFCLKLNLFDHRSILTDLQGTLKEKWRYLIPAKPPIHNHVLIPNYQDFKIQDFRYSDGLECFQAIKIGSTSRGIQFLGDKLVRWMSKKQNCTAMSSAEAEYVALSASCAQIMWMRTQLQDYGFNYNKIPLYCDSQSAIVISCNPVQHSRTKHIHTRYHFIKEQVENGIIELYFVRTEYQLADMFTKALPEDRFKYLVSRIGMRCLTPAELEVLAKESA
nr:retrovirus-related Pol polyprotein from transposon TNT 1-94 [Tanacetum cinerariifolium]